MLATAMQFGSRVLFLWYFAVLFKNNPKNQAT